MATDRRTTPVTPIPAADALYVDVLRTALKCYERGDYRRAADLFQDAGAVGGYRADAAAWATLGAELQALLSDHTLTSKDAAFASADEARA